MICHYCGEQVEFNPKDNLCQFCKSQNKIVTAGVGVEKLEQVVKHLFPAARTITVSSDLIGHSSQKSAELIRKITENEVDIIIGTQILAKGLHFEKLHLVVIVEANNEYISPDIRALEKTYQVLQQVIGRAGRESARGLVIVQTSNPSDEMIRYIVNYDEKGFIEMELRNRERALMPPFARLAAITVSSTDEVRLLEWLKDFSRDVNVLNTEDLTILGPAPAPIYKLRNKFRYRFIIRAKKSISIQKVIKELLSKLFKPSYIDFKIDIDPYNFI